ncbi:hypothetical protein IDJ77_18310 [Mucilaginibacter sp. ZT4R22]|uniref:Uncharacterized protein n=1 Tax=Mucilaginibacter pankratovii TaxID=2772110 RepID=A0ABR7WTZ5_9SPHI|nr:hypothetical protein [Mucilaginibacter pankratovii]MBD1365776.1 hypothetical protein [Mucilaginibacter pankratovii]
MKEQTKDKQQIIKEKFGIKLTLNEELNKYSGPEYAPEKLKKIEQRFAKQPTHK